MGDARFEAKIDKRPDGCWLWTGHVNSDGYGKLLRLGKQWNAHRYAWRMWRGLIPDGHEIDHLCHVRNCVNPSHLEPVSRSENIRRVAAAGRHRFSAERYTHCKRGHEFTPENTRITADGNRVCRTCARDATRAWAQAQRAARGAPPAPALRTHCPQGHPYSEANTGYRLNGKRRCRECERLRAERKRRAEGTKTVGQYAKTVGRV